MHQNQSNITLQKEKDLVGLIYQLKRSILIGKTDSLYEMKVGNYSIEDLYRADEVFMTGKTVEIQLMRNIKKNFQKLILI